MRIHWKKISSDKQDIYINDKLVGYVKQQANCKWMCFPSFNFLRDDAFIFSLQYDGSVEAEREMSKAWENWEHEQSFLNFEDYDDGMFDYIDDICFTD